LGKRFVELARIIFLFCAVLERFAVGLTPFFMLTDDFGVYRWAFLVFFVFVRWQGKWQGGIAAMNGRVVNFLCGVGLARFAVGL
jgi:hypothetical protein